jgi:hypothetical protein
VVQSSGISIYTAFKNRVQNVGLVHTILVSTTHCIISSYRLLFSIAKDFRFPNSFRRVLEGMWNRAADENPSFGNRPTKKKMTDDYGKKVRDDVLRGSMDPTSEVDIEDVPLLSAMVCGTMFGFRGVKVSSLYYVSIPFIGWIHSPSIF